MTDNGNQKSAVFGRIVVWAIAAIIAGAALLLVAIVLEWSGFWGGLVQGGGIGLMAVGAYFWGFGNGIRRAGPRASWLPSQDAHR
ncbi:hypothetical protein NQ152_02195 [Microbacterium sp. zg.B48]|uniref:hypothetical protein n=1 Tax=Microbacterium sp. zg.B48 TaxID=2969408 RepID=UPI00214BA4A1|nr:hypothetical protein [Microbacterium sp. zg.B48]MCR2762313.1 hypothetical protein [Microbacterium sp. zg.B48]